MKNSTSTLILTLVTALLPLIGASARAQVNPQHAGTYDFVYGEKQGSCAGKFGLGVMTVTSQGQITGSYRNQADGSTGTFRGSVNAQGNATLTLNDGSRVTLKLRSRSVIFVDGDYSSGSSRGFVAGVRK